MLLKRKFFLHFLRNVHEPKKTALRVDQMSYGDENIRFEFKFVLKRNRMKINLINFRFNEIK